MSTSSTPWAKPACVILHHIERSIISQVGIEELTFLWLEKSAEAFQNNELKNEFIMNFLTKIKIIKLAIHEIILDSKKKNYITKIMKKI